MTLGRGLNEDVIRAISQARGEPDFLLRFRNALCEKGFSFEYSATFGQAVILAAHSMPSVARVMHGDAGQVRADVVPGTRGRSSADGRFIT